MRDKLFGQGRHLGERHPATRYRGAFTEFSALVENRTPVAV